MQLWMQRWVRLRRALGGGSDRQREGRECGVMTGAVSRALPRPAGLQATEEGFWAGTGAVVLGPLRSDPSLPAPSHRSTGTAPLTRPAASCSLVEKVPDTAKHGGFLVGEPRGAVAVLGGGRARPAIQAGHHRKALGHLEAPGPAERERRLLPATCCAAGPRTR